MNITLHTYRSRESLNQRLIDQLYRRSLKLLTPYEHQCGTKNNCLNSRVSFAVRTTAALIWDRLLLS